MRTMADVKDAEDAPYRAFPAAVVGAHVVQGARNRDAVMFFGTKREAEVVRDALNQLWMDG